MSIYIRMLFVAFSAFLIPLTTQSALPNKVSSQDQKHFGESNFCDITTLSAAGIKPAIQLATPHIFQSTEETRYEGGLVVITRKIDNYLTDACQRGDIERVKALLKAGANPNNLGSIYHKWGICNALGATLVYDSGGRYSEGPSFSPKNIPLIAILAKAGAKDFSGVGWINCPPPLELYIGKKEVTQALKAAGLHPRTSALASLLGKSFPKVLGEIILAYIPHQEDVSDAIMQADEKGLREHISKPGFNANAVCLTGGTPLYTVACILVDRLPIDIENHDFKLKEVIAQLRAGGANPNLPVAGKESPIALMKNAMKKEKTKLKTYSEYKRRAVERNLEIDQEYLDALQDRRTAGQACCVIS